MQQLSDPKQRVLAFAVANLVVGVFNLIHLGNAVIIVPMVIADPSGTYRDGPYGHLAVPFVAAFAVLALVATALPLAAGVQMLRRRPGAYALHLLAAVPGGLLFFPPLGLVYIGLVAACGCGRAARAGLRGA
jgi:hypothetical protein